MNVLIQKSSHVNSDSLNGSISGRGLARRRLSPGELRALAADVATGHRPFQPSLAQTADLFGVTVADLREELKVRALTLESEHESEAVGSIVTAWLDASELERETAIRTIGVANVWDVLSRVVA